MGLFKPLYNNPATLINTEFSQTADEFAVGKGTFNGLSGIAVDVKSAAIVNMPAAPTASSALEAVSAAWVTSSISAAVNGLIAKLSLKGSVTVLADSNQALTGLPTIDGITLTDGQTVALTAQTTASQNGNYIVHSGAWARTADFANGASAAGYFFYVEEGTKYANEIWAVNSIPGSDVVGTNNLTFAQIGAVPTGITTQGHGVSYTNGVIKLNYGAGVADGANGITAQVDGNGIQINGSSQIGLALVSGGPLSASTAGVALNVQAGVFQAGSTLSLIGLPTTANLNLLYQGNYADSVHKHTGVRVPMANGSTAITAGAPVYMTSAGTLAASDAATSATAGVIGIAAAAIAASATGDVIVGGVCAGTLSGATPGAKVYLAVGGGTTTTAPTATGNVVHVLGIAQNATDLVYKPTTSTVTRT